MTIVDVYTERKSKQVVSETWGHLAPVPRTAYSGFILFCLTPTGDSLLLDFDFDGLDGNPWTLEHVSDWWGAETYAYEPAKKTAFWRWDGTYTVLKNGSAKFEGRIVELSLTPPSRGEGV